ncbi:aminotransferase class III-fold pyridoxal phosphate-dependent enzyme [Streptomyces sp. NPDC002788]
MRRTQVKSFPGGAAEDTVPAARSAQEVLPRRQSARESAARTYARALPIVPVRARGLTIEGADGRRYLDCLSGAGALALGHNHPVVLGAIRKVLDSGAPLNALDFTTPVKEAFVTELLRTLPPELAARARVRFCGPSGSDALHTASELARAATGRTGLVTFTGAHHCTATGSLDASADTRAARPTSSRGYHCPYGLEGERGVDHAADWAASLLGDPGPGRSLPAGMIVEPVQGEGGVLPAPDAWLRRMRQLTADRSVPLIADEIQTGVGRTGAFWAVQHSGVCPDVMVLSDAIGGSLPLAVVVHRDDLGTGEPDTQAAPFRGNQLAMAAGAATLAHVRENGLAERAATVGSRMLDQLQGLVGQFACVGEVRGRGLMIGVELVDRDASGGAEGTGGGKGAPGAHDSGRRTLPAAPDLAAAVQRECLRRGLIVGLGGRPASVVRLLPPLTITDEQAAAVLDRLADAVGTVARCHGAALQHRVGE